MTEEEMTQKIKMQNPQNQNIDPNLDLVAEIKRLKTEMNAVILAHYYQDDEIQDIADFIGDSLDLSRKAQASNADVIVFCGVKFMAEVAKILSPNKTVILPDLDAGCSLEDSCQPAEFKKFRAEHPNHLALTYINCSADIKALSDIIVTSSCAEKIINQIPKDQPILFSPDKHLGAYLAKKTGRDMLLWNGSCMVHINFSERELVKLKTKYPQAKTIAHPECPEELLRHADFIGSTSALLNYTKQAENKAAEYIVLTEPGILHQMRKYSPEAKFYDVAGVSDINVGSCANCNNCPYMKLNTLEKLYLAMLNKTPQIELTPQQIVGAKASLDKMLEMSA
jgi:quinolinate synthase